MMTSARRARPEPLLDSGSRSDAAAYVAALTDELSRIARRGGMPTLAYLLDIARLEAEGHVRRGEPDVDGETSDPGVRRP